MSLSLTLSRNLREERAEKADFKIGLVSLVEFKSPAGVAQGGANLPPLHQVGRCLDRVGHVWVSTAGQVDAIADERHGSKTEARGSFHEQQTILHV